MNLTTILAIVGGAFGIFGTLFKVSDVVRKIENRQDSRYASLAERIATLEGRMNTYDNLNQDNR